MPIHDWTRVDAGLFHAFHQGWINALSCALNTGGLPPRTSSLSSNRRLDSIRSWTSSTFFYPCLLDTSSRSGGQLTRSPWLPDPPRARLVRASEGWIYVRKADRITVRRQYGQVVAVVEIGVAREQGEQ